MARTLRCIAFSIKHHKFKWYTDNAGVCSIISKGSMKTDLQNIALDIFSYCVENCVILDVESIPRTLNEKADYFSKIIDFDDWGLSAELFYILQSKWGPLDVDWFVSEHNAKLERFYTRF